MTIRLVQLGQLCKVVVDTRVDYENSRVINSKVGLMLKVYLQTEMQWGGKRLIKEFLSSITCLQGRLSTVTYS